MPRPREFDEETALDRALECFWHRGYEATSVRDLAERMEISGASLYNAFRDKPSLFRIVLERYIERSVRERIERLEDSRAPLEAIRGFFREIVERSLADPDRRGCLLVNSALEVAPHDDELGKAIGACLAEIEAFFHRSIEAGQRDGTISPACPARDAARLLLSAVLGLRVLSRSRPNRSLLEAVARAALATLEARRGLPS